MAIFPEHKPNPHQLTPNEKHCSSLERLHIRIQILEDQGWSMVGDIVTAPDGREWNIQNPIALRNAQRAAIIAHRFPTK